MGANVPGRQLGGTKLTSLLGGLALRARTHTTGCLSSSLGLQQNCAGAGSAVLPCLEGSLFSFSSGKEEKAASLSPGNKPHLC